MCWLMCYPFLTGTFKKMFIHVCWLICYPLPNRDVQEDVCPEAQGAAERVREAGEEAEGDEGVREIHKAGGEFLVSVCV